MKPPIETPWPKLILVCCNNREGKNARKSCGSNGPTIRNWFKAGIRERNLDLTVRASTTGCLECCEAGPVVAVFPDDCWYKVENKKQVDAILDRHIIGGEQVESLRLDIELLPVTEKRRRHGS